MAEETFLFRNTTQGMVGVTKIDRRGDRTGIAVAPGETVELTEEEQEVTARAPRDPSNNPFEAQRFEIRDAAGEVTESGVRPPLELVVDDQRPTPAKRRTGTGQQAEAEVGAAPVPVGFAPQGTYAPGEEVGTP